MTTESKITRDTDDLSEVTAWYLNGTLSDSDQVWAEQAIAQNKPGQDELEFDSNIRNELAAEMAEIPADIGWNSLLGQARAQVAEANPVKRVEPTTGWIATLLQRLFSPAAGMALACLVAVQAVTLGLVMRDDQIGGTETYRSGETIRPVPVLRAIFVESITESQLRDVLIQNKLRIVDGPTPFGEYILRSDQSDLDAVGAQLKASGAVEHFTVDMILVPR